MFNYYYYFAFEELEKRKGKFKKGKTFFCGSRPMFQRACWWNTAVQVKTNWVWKRKFPPPSGSWSFPSDLLLTSWSHVYFTEQTKSLNLSASPCHQQNFIKEPFQGNGNSPGPQTGWVTPCVSCAMPSEWGSLSCCRASQGQVKAFIFPSTKTGQMDLIIQIVFYWLFLVCGKHGEKGFTSIDLWILHNHMIEAANILLALQTRLLRFRQKAIWLWL